MINSQIEFGMPVQGMGLTSRNTTKKFTGGLQIFINTPGFIKIFI